SQTIDFKQEDALSFTQDIVGPAEQRLEVELQLTLSSALADVSMDMDYTVEGVLSGVSLRTLNDLRSETGTLPPGTLKDTLEQALGQVEAAIAEIRNAGNGISIDTLYHKLKDIEKALDKQFIDRVNDCLEISRTDKGRLLVVAKPIEQRYDYLEYIASKVRLYARDEVKPQIASLLRETVLHLTDGNKAAYIRDLEELLARVDQYRGEMIKEEEADRIREKVDLLLQKIAERGTENLWGVDLSTTVGGIDLDGTLTWESDDYRAPSKDVRTRGLELGAESAGEGWEISTSYEWECRDYLDRLKDDDDKITSSVDLSLSCEIDPWETTASVLFADEFYPNYIDDEIESDRVTQAIAAIQSLINEVRALGLPAAVEDDLLKELGEEGALGELVAGDRREAVDQLEDFIDEVYDAKWEVKITGKTAQTLIDRALSILPRKRMRQLNLPLALDFPFRGGDMTIDVEWERKLYPADSLLDRDTTTGEVAYTREVEISTLTGSLKQEELTCPHAETKNRFLEEWEIKVETQHECYDLTSRLFQQETTYPHAETKNRFLEEWEIKVETQHECYDLTSRLFQQETTYPHDAVKDKQVQEGDFTLSFDLTELGVTAKLTEKVTHYPNDSDKPAYREEDLDLDVSWEIGEGTIQVELSDEVHRTAFPSADETLVKESRSVDLSWKGDITDDLEICLSSLWKRVVYWEEPEKDSTELTLEIDFALSI
ncbi:hypothetical protein KAU37_03235, partial [Candidatus Bipolaricaulota bacterium]|nr:hypothetical protein [Candidatus Bipolaricaulota bacterium]